MSDTHLFLGNDRWETLVRAEALARDVLAPVAAAGEQGRVNRSLLEALAQHGLLGQVFRQRTDGGVASRVSAVDLCLLREGLARFCTEAETALALQGLGGYPILLGGKPDVVREWLPRIAGGRVAAAFAVTEPEAGSDATALTLDAVPVPGGFRLNGEKTFISNAPEAGIYSVFARTGAGKGGRGITAFAVPGDSAGLGGSPLRLIAPHPIGRLGFHDVFVPDSHVLGDVDHGWDVARRTLTLFRPSVGAFAVGMGQAALDAAVGHTARRSAFGRPLRGFQGVSHQLAEVATRLQGARLLVYDAAVAHDGGEPGVARRAAMAKLFATETAQVAVDVAIQVHGARALEEDHVLAHLYREVRAPRIYEGASEIQRDIIAGALFRGADARLDPSS
ncbi:acyl-CoA dehydrogenase [Longimycelium tulufanense]|uniref:Acyl-CoA dehydrogenase n=1 Tax=Longimycelium tulufanense TaxID=907463 RepID=A0A8J3FVQ7_9PSEU|nr:acyl-CoA dehydrogenase family protein [Longimycelium tulufanense]GGM46695.1 acyl-CoA dehydrogenase [Longimycelium tulufanense]